MRVNMCAVGCVFMHGCKHVCSRVCAVGCVGMHACEHVCRMVCEHVCGGCGGSVGRKPAVLVDEVWCVPLWRSAGR